MARFRRRRKARPIWFPPLGAQFTIGDTTTNTGFVTFSLDVPADGSIAQAEVALTFDFGEERLLNFASQVTPTITLADLAESSWRLRRAVGKIHATFFPGTLIDNVFEGTNNAVPACYFAAGLMVRKVDSQGNIFNNVNLLERDDYIDPWIWRRTWVLGQGVETGLQSFSAGNPWGTVDTFPTVLGARAFREQVAFSTFPQTNAHYGSVLDGPHIDAKTNRVIGPEDRLFLHFTTKALPIQPQAQYVTDSSVLGVYDLRLLGNLLRSSNRRNASR